MLKIKYAGNETLWAIENEAKKHGYKKTSECYWAQIFTNADGDEIRTERDEENESDALEILAGYFDEADSGHEINVFINTWGNYNENGAAGGQWVTLPMNADALRGTLERIATQMGDADPEFCIHDYDTFSNIKLNIGENSNIFDVNNLAEKIEALATWELETYAAACEYWGADWVDIDNLDDYYLYSDINDNYDLGYYWAVESGCCELDDNNPLSRYFDYEAFGRDIAIEADGGFTEYGFIERR